MVDAVLDDVAEFVFVQAALDSGDKGDGQPSLGAVVQGPLLERPQVSAADLQVGALVEA
jgi:hypothetical protein